MKYLKLNTTSAKVSNPIVSFANNKLGVSRLNDGENHLITETGNVYPDSNVCLCSPNFIQDKGNYGGNYEFSDYYNTEYLMYISRVKDIENHKYLSGTYQMQKRQHTELFVHNKSVKKAFYFIQCIADLYTLFTTPFEVQNIYVVETPAEVENNIQTNQNIRSEFLAIQEPYNDKFIYEFYKRLNSTGEMLGINDKQYGELIKLTNLVGTNWDANYFLWYQQNPSSDITNWQNFENIISENYTIPAKTVLSANFPYSTPIDRNTYDYWTGKYIILESVDNPEITDDFDINVFPTATNMYTTCGNYTLHNVDISIEENYQILDEQSRTYQSVEEDQTTITLTHGNAIVKYTE